MKPKIYLKIDSVWDWMGRKEISTQAKLAELVKVTGPTISDALSGKPLGRKTAEAVALALGAKFDDVAYEDRQQVQIGPLAKKTPPSDIRSAVEKLQRIYQARESHDPEAAKAWEWITGNLTMFCRGLAVEQPVIRSGPKGRVRNGG